MSVWGTVAGLSAALVPLVAGAALAAEAVRFEGARVPVSEFQQRRAQARGEVLQPTPGESVQAHVVKPSGPGPHPVIVYLPDCGGLAPEVKGAAFDTEGLTKSPEQGGVADASREVFWTRRLLAWGYAVVLVDSNGSRGLTDTCADVKKGNARVVDAYGALAFAATQPWADPARIGILGFLTGDHWRVPQAGDKTSFVLPPETFKGAVAFVYSPSCGLFSPMAAPTLVINGVPGADKAESCPKVTAQASVGGAPSEERVRPDLFKTFEPNSPMPDKAVFADWLKAEPQKAGEAAEMVKAFFAERLGR